MRLNLKRNVCSAVAEVLASALVLVFLYKYIVAILGLEALGIWSLVAATTSFGRIADLGASTGLGRFVASTRARGEMERSLSYVETSFITNLALYTAIALAIWIPARHALALTISGPALTEARLLLPYSLASFVLLSGVSTTTGGIVGQHRSDQKSLIVIAGLGIQCFVSVAFLKHSGLRALAWGQLAQYAFLILASWQLFLRNHFGRWTFRIPLRWRKSEFAELVGFGLRLQVSTIASMVFDPLTKFLMSRFGGLELVGLFELTQRLLSQARQLLVLPMQPLVPTFAHLKETETDKIKILYKNAVSIAVLIGLPLMALIATLSPLISIVWIGHVSSLFVALLSIMSLGWYASILTAPAFLLGVAVGYVQWILRGTAVTLIGFCLICAIVGKPLGGIGVSIVASAMMLIGYLLMMVANCRYMRIPALPTVSDLKNVLGSINKIDALKRVFSSFRDLRSRDF